MNFIRPNVRAHFAKWSEAYLVALIIIMGIRVLIRGFVIQSIIYEAIGGVTIILGLVLLRGTIQRIQFKRSQKAPGMVDVTEREISYFGPMHGKTVSLESLFKIELRESEAYASVWVLHNSEGDPMIVPTSAKGSDRLFDAFTSLSGVKMDVLVKAVNTVPVHSHVIWERI
ncbi:hypothetical protein F9L33_11485 [Amylibacter sp. SFDW26]|uniref:hypothetical protein n=1 Tax=Amylibacter sp. SFDW26 TaxID=2652722 RepID=UPI001261860F|nr:hypothetical protein [Amylibacter sp. SFDW26]KAB7613970.1 hypothetical protein F9L33_11485 [Amylibacter sp. SFDW26]